MSNKTPANYGLDVVKGLPSDIETGIYFGWAAVDNGSVHKMVMSIGWNPFYHNTEKSMVSEEYVFIFSKLNSSKQKLLEQVFLIFMKYDVFLFVGNAYNA